MTEHRSERFRARKILQMAEPRSAARSGPSCRSKGHVLQQGWEAVGNIEGTLATSYRPLLLQRWTRPPQGWECTNSDLAKRHWERCVSFRRAPLRGFVLSLASL